MKFANTGKYLQYIEFLDEYRRVLEIAVDELWTWERVPLLIDRKKFSHVKTWLGQHALGCLLKQASGIVRGTKSSAQHLGKTPSKHNVREVCPELSPAMVKVDWETKTSFDVFLTIKNISHRVNGKNTGRKIIVPLKKTTHFNKMSSKGEMTDGCRLSKKGITFMFKSSIEQKTEGDVLGIDVGISDLWSDSRGERSTSIKHPHKWTLSKVMKRLSSRRKGSKGFKRAQDLRDNFIGWSLNRLNLEGVKEIKIENIKHMRRGKHCDRFRSHWSYPKIFRKIEQMSEENGVRLSKVNPRNTSRRCSFCGAVSADSRRRKVFHCVACGHTQDADLNAAVNISFAEAKPQHRGTYSSSEAKKVRSNGTQNFE